MFLFFEGLQPQMVFILFLFSMKHTCPWRKLLLIYVGDIGVTEYLNATLEVYVIIFPSETFDYITKDDFGDVHVILL